MRLETLEQQAQAAAQALLRATSEQRGLHTQREAQRAILESADLASDPLELAAARERLKLLEPAYDRATEAVEGARLAAERAERTSYLARERLEDAYARLRILLASSDLTEVRTLSAVELLGRLQANRDVQLSMTGVGPWIELIAENVGIVAELTGVMLLALPVMQPAMMQPAA